MNQNSQPADSRRTFLKKSSLAVAASVAAPYILSERSYAQSSDTLKVGLIGCGGRGTGAAGQALSADKNVVLTAMGDAFESQLDGAHKALVKEHKDKIKVEADKEIIPNPAPIPDPTAALVPEGVLGRAPGHVWVMRRAIGNGPLLVYDVGPGGVKLRPAAPACRR